MTCAGKKQRKRKKQKKWRENLQISNKLLTFASAIRKGSGFSAVGSAHVWGARGRWFESSNPDNPTIGILLCSETSEDIARYSVLHDSKQLFASKYLTYLPTKDELRREIEAQKEIFRLQQNEEK